MKKLIYSLIILFTSVQVIARNSNYLIFNEKTDGPWFPIQLYINGSFDVIQNPYWFNQKDYFEKHKIVWNKVKDPIHSIKKNGGLDTLLKEEFLSNRVLPNIFLHTFGGAYETKKLMEYSDYYGIKWAKTFSFIVTYAMHFGNEANETTQPEVSALDHIADLYIYDVAAFLLGLNDPFMNFMVDEMGMTTWHFMPVYDVEHEDFFNVGLNYIMRPKLLHFNKFRPLLYMGMMNLVGLTYDNGDLSHSVAAGMAFTDPLEQKGRFAYGYFLETMGRQAASLLMNSSEDFRVRLNLYPALFHFYADSASNFALMLGQTKNDDFAFGINYELPISIGNLN
ncbi:hypothetical protein [Halobacteriovorax sp. RT-1-4]|uniref:hypothetical protein n=1 Tax=unclassified Halobacteriovorax TaxID=2639665 RepID=UPI00399ABBFF